MFFYRFCLSLLKSLEATVLTERDVLEIGNIVKLQKTRFESNFGPDQSVEDEEKNKLTKIKNFVSKYVLRS